MHSYFRLKLIRLAFVQVLVLCRCAGVAHRIGLYRDIARVYRKTIGHCFNHFIHTSDLSCPINIFFARVEAVRYIILYGIIENHSLLPQQNYLLRNSWMFSSSSGILFNKTFP